MPRKISPKISLNVSDQRDERFPANTKDTYKSVTTGFFRRDLSLVKARDIDALKHILQNYVHSLHFWNDGVASSANNTGCSGIMVDFDNSFSIAEIQKRFKIYTHVLYTSTNHTEQTPKFHLFLLFSPALGLVYPEAAQGLMDWCRSQTGRGQLFEGSDGSCFEAARKFFPFSAADAPQPKQMQFEINIATWFQPPAVSEFVTNRREAMACDITPKEYGAQRTAHIKTLWDCKTSEYRAKDAFQLALDCFRLGIAEDVALEQLLLWVRQQEKSVPFGKRGNERIDTDDAIRRRLQSECINGAFSGKHPYTPPPVSEIPTGFNRAEVLKHQNETEQESPANIVISGTERYTRAEMCFLDLRIDGLNLTNPHDLEVFNQRTTLKTALIAGAHARGDKALIAAIKNGEPVIVATHNYLRTHQTELTDVQQVEVGELVKSIYSPNKLPDSFLLKDLLYTDAKDLIVEDLDIIGNFCVRGATSIFHGREKMGKTTIVMSEVVHILKKYHNVRVLWLACEDENGTKRRKKRLIDNQPFEHRFMLAKQPKSRAMFVAAVYAFRPDIIVIDTLNSFLAPVYGDKLPELSNSIAWGKIIKEFHTMQTLMNVASVLLIDHQSKPVFKRDGTEKEQVVGGSGGKMNEADFLIAFESHHGDPGGFGVCKWRGREAQTGFAQRFNHLGFEKDPTDLTNRSKWRDNGYDMSAALPISAPSTREARIAAMIAYLEKHAGMTAKRTDVANAAGVDPKARTTLIRLSEQINLSDKYTLIEETRSGEVYWMLSVGAPKRKSKKKSADPAAHLKADNGENEDTNNE